MSLYANYITERTDDHIVEEELGFATYRYVDEKTVYIMDIYTDPAVRQLGHGGDLADKIVKEAKAKGCTELLGTVIPSTKGSTASLKVLLAYGMTLKSAEQNLIVFRKDI